MEDNKKTPEEIFREEQAEFNASKETEEKPDDIKKVLDVEVLDI